jgi:hypothetical protein
MSKDVLFIVIIITFLFVMGHIRILEENFHQHQQKVKCIEHPESEICKLYKRA